ncbi:MAG: hypothetical protein QGH47_06605 [Candidatus Woesearchaeota archaeon]|jgi:hypothetical protein|nr:hypothetical protein [Candidatus Woesearchaeota archaeon]
MKTNPSFNPLKDRQVKFNTIKQKLTKKDFFGEAPAPFVGRWNYPNINVGILSPVDLKDNTWEYDAPRHWSSQDYQIPNIIDFRSELINSRFTANIKDQNKMLNITQEVGMASKPVELEINLEKTPFFRIDTDKYVAPTGPKGKITKARITSNPKISPKVDYVVSDYGLKAADAAINLYEKGFDEQVIQKLLSVGTLGVKTQRKLVPTRWSITAADDTVGKHLIENVKKFQEADYQAFLGGYLGNYYLILLFPEPWSYELFETYVRGGWKKEYDLEYMHDFELYEGRKSYVTETAGGYYTVRLAILEKLKEMKKQATAIALRFITDEYTLPMGVWVTRQAARRAMDSKPIKFSDKALMIKYAELILKKKFNFNIHNLLNESHLYRKQKYQTKLNAF